MPVSNPTSIPQPSPSQPPATEAATGVQSVCVDPNVPSSQASILGHSATNPPRSFASVAKTGVISKTDVVTVVIGTLNNINKRKFNLVITGLPEDSNRNDSAIASNFFEQFFTNALLTPITTAIRLGKNKGNQPRRLLVRLSSEAEARAFLQESIQLRRSCEQFAQLGIFINPDLTREQETVEYNKRVSRRLKTSETGHVTNSRPRGCPLERAPMGNATGGKSQVGGHRSLDRPASSTLPGGSRGSVTGYHQGSSQADGGKRLGHGSGQVGGGLGLQQGSSLVGEAMGLQQGSSQVVGAMGLHQISSQVGGAMGLQKGSRQVDGAMGLQQGSRQVGEAMELHMGSSQVGVGAQLNCDSVNINSKSKSLSSLRPIAYEFLPSTLRDIPVITSLRTVVSLSSSPGLGDNFSSANCPSSVSMSPTSSLT